MPRSLLLAAVALVACGLPRIAPRSYVTPAPAPTPIEVCWLETAGLSASGGFGTAGWTRADTWQATTSAVLVRHPKGDVLIDSGLAPDAETQAEELAFWPRFVFHQTAGRNVLRTRIDELLAKVPKARLDGIILSHAHPDHAGGLTLLPGVRVWLTAEEEAYARSGLDGTSSGIVPAQARSLEGRITRIPFTATRYANYDQSWDVFGDGAIVVVPTFGHTPGSVATFVNLGDRRLVHVGDLINLQESVDRGVTKSALMRGFTDEDPAATDKQVARLVELHRQDPDLWILPAHDRVAYEGFFGAMPLESPGPRCVRTTDRKSPSSSRSDPARPSSASAAPRR